MSRRRQGRMVAAMIVPRYVIAMTSVASSVYVEKPGLYAYSALIPTDGMIITTSAPYGTRRFAEMLATHAGSTRSKAAAKITLVEERKSVPAQPKNQDPITRIRTNWKA